MSGTLYVVATPIGNLEDLSFRALRLLREAALIAAEDTRRTGRLLSHYGLATPTLSFHAHNAHTRLPVLLARLQAGEHVALVTDAGTPGISDPGRELVEACVAHNIPVDPIPGPSAPLVAAVASGFPLEPITVYGFPPPRSNNRKQWLAEVAEAVPHTFVFLEAPHRVRQTLADAVDILGVRPLVVCREMTKVHQQFLRGTSADVLTALEEVRGEFTVVVGPKVPEDRSEEVPVTPAEIHAEFCHMTDSGSGRRAAIAAIARRHGLSSRDVYAAVEKTKDIR
ncbi:MAG: 16S rRNA (cytidine(1402)-2'-O)-methyltransferase [Vicinamibacterales bacterium]